MFINSEIKIKDKPIPTTKYYTTTNNNPTGNRWNCIKVPSTMYQSSIQLTT